MEFVRQRRERKCLSGKLIWNVERSTEDQDIKKGKWIIKCIILTSTGESGKVG